MHVYRYETSHKSEMSHNANEMELLNKEFLYLPQ